MTMKKRSVLRLAAVLPVLILCFSVLTTTAFAAGIPLPIYGHVTVNGEHIQGVTVSAGGSSTTTDSGGFYQLTPSVENGSSVTVTANYQGHTTAQSATQHNNQGSVQIDLAITYTTTTPTPTATPTATVTVTPTATATTKPNSGSGSTQILEGYNGVGSATPTATPTTQPTTQPTTTPMPTQTPTDTPVPTSEPSGNNTTIYLALGTIAILAIAGAAYLLWKKK
jgi:hypothetical protein